MPPAADNTLEDVLDAVEAQLLTVLGPLGWELSPSTLAQYLRDTGEQLHKSYCTGELGSRLSHDDGQPYRRGRRADRYQTPMDSQFAVAFAWNLRADGARADAREALAEERTVREAVLGMTLPTTVRLRWDRTERRESSDHKIRVATLVFTAWHEEHPA